MLKREKQQCPWTQQEGIENAKPFVISLQLPILQSGQLGEPFLFFQQF